MQSEKAERNDTVILSASRRTDIPNYYSDWFLNRIKEGWLYVRNPFNPRQISKIALSPDVVDCIVFWTKNPEPMLARLGELSDYAYYFQFTLTGFGRDMEPFVPHKKREMIPIFQKLSDQIGSERVIWRYDPIIFTDRYSPAYHLRAFEQIASALRGRTFRCVISFVDLYRKNKREMDALRAYFLPEADLTAFAGELSSIAGSNGMTVATCAEELDLSSVGIEHNSCIDIALIEKITGCRLRASRDRNQREVCGCMESIEIGAYNTCRNGCRYCYANESPGAELKNSRNCDDHSPILCGTASASDRITERKVKSLREGQARGSGK